MLQIPDQIEQDQRAEQQQNVDAQIQRIAVRIVLDHLLQILGHKHIVHATAAEQIDDQECVDNEAGEARPFVQAGRSGQKCRLGDVGERQRRRLRAPAQNVRALYQDVDAVRANDADHKGGGQAEPQATVGEG